MVLTVLGDDPATSNYGRSILLVEKESISSSIKFKIARSYMVKSLIKSEAIKTDISSVISAYARSFIKSKLHKRYPRIDYYSAERFMPRSGAGTVQGAEAITSMLTLNTFIFGYPTICKWIPAVTWKSQIKRYYDLKELYSSIKPCPDHLLDSVLIGVYSVYFHEGIKPYSTLSKLQMKYVIRRLRRIGIKLKAKADEAKRIERERKAEEKRNDKLRNSR